MQKKSRRSAAIVIAVLILLIAGAYGLLRGDAATPAVPPAASGESAFAVSSSAASLPSRATRLSTTLVALAPKPAAPAGIVKTVLNTSTDTVEAMLSRQRDRLQARLNVNNITRYASLFSLTGNGRNGDVLTIKDGMPAWQNLSITVRGIIEELNQQGSGRKPESYYPGTTERHYGGGGGATSGGTTTTSGGSSGQSQADADARYVNVSGDSMIGALTITYSGTGLIVQGAMSGYTMNLSDLKNCDSIDTDANGRLICGTDNAVGVGLSQLSGDARYVNVSGDTMTGGLSINLTTGYLGLNIVQTASGNVIHAEKNLTSSGTLIVKGDATFDIDTLFVDAANNRVGVGTTAPKARLDVLGTASGTDLYAANSISGSNLYAAKTFGGAGLASCSNAANSKLLYNSTTKTFTCGTDQGSQWSNTGSLQTAFDGRFVNVSGDTMTGNLIVRSISGSTSNNFFVAGGMSGNYLYVNKFVAFSNSGVIITATGQTVFNEQSRDVDFRIESDGNVNAFFVDASTDRVGIGTNAPKATLDVLGTASGTNLYAAASITGSDIYAAVRFAGAGLTSCSNATTSKLLYNSATKQFSCGSDQNSGGSGSTEVGTSSFSGAVKIIGDLRYVNVHGDTMTGNLVIRSTSGATSFNFLTSGGMSGNYLSVSKNAVFANSGVIITASGQTVFNEQSRDVDFRIESDGNVNAFFVDASTDRVGIGTNAPKATLDVLGTASGTDLYAANSISGTYLYAAKTFGGAGLASCNAVDSKLLYNSTTKKFECGTDQGGSGTGMTQGSGDTRYVNVSGDTMTGALTINVTGGSINTIGLKILNTFSGAIIHAERMLTSSGVIISDSGAIINRPANSEFIKLNDTTNNASIGMYTGTGDPNGVVSGTRSSLFFASDTAKIWKNTDGATAWTELSTGSGSIHMVKMRRAAAQSIPHNFNQKIYFDTEEFDVGNIGNVVAGATGSGRVTVSRTGKYLVTGSWQIENELDDGKLMNIVIQKNGVNQAVGVTYSPLAGSYSAASVTTMLEIAAGEYIEVFVYQNNGTTVSTRTAAGVQPELSVVQIQDNLGSVGAGLSQDNADLRYVNVSGDTMTGALTVNVTGGNINTIGLRILNTFSGAIIHAERSLSSSGTLAVKGDATFDTNTMVVDSSNNRVGIGTTTPKATLDVLGTASGIDIYASRNVSGSNIFANKSITGTHLYAATTFGGAGLASCSNAQNSKLLYNSTTKQFTCGVDYSNGGTSTGALQAAFDNRYVKKSGDTMTGALRIDLTTSGFLGLNIAETASGNVIHAEKELSSSGTIIATGNIATKSTLSGAALTIMNGSSYALGTFGIGTSSVDSGLKLEVVGTISGSTIHANTLLRSSGALIVEGNAFFDSTTLFVDSSNDRVGVGTTAPKATLDVLGTASGTDIYASRNVSGSNIFANKSITGTHLYAATTFGGAGLASCSNAQTSKLLYNSTTKTFTCGVDYSGWSNTGALQAGFDTRYVNVSGDTMTGALVINVTGGNQNTLGLNVLNTISGAVIHAEKTLSASGVLLVESGANIAGNTLVVHTDGHVGIGTNTPSEALVIGPDLGNMSAGNAIVISHASTNSALMMGESASYFANTYYDPSDDDFTLYTIYNGLSNAGGNQLVLDGPTGNIGIRTDAPKAALDVLGTISGANLVISNRTTFSGAVLLGDSTSDLTTIKSRLSGSLIPVTTNLYDLGSNALRWRDLYLSGGTIKLGASGDEATIKYNTSANRLQFDVNADGTPEFRMTQNNTFDMRDVSANADTESNYARIFSRANTGGGNDSNTTYLVNAESEVGTAQNTGMAATSTAAHAGGCITQNTDQAKFGTRSILFNCTRYQYYRVSNTNDDYFLNSDFTVDLWVYEDSNTSVNRFLMGLARTNDHQWSLQLTSGNKLQGNFKSSTGMTITITDTDDFPTLQFVHIALERNGSTFRVYKNGTSIGSHTYGGNLKVLSTSGRRLVLGNRMPPSFSGDENFTGYMDEIRISKTARYNGNFTPAIAAYSKDSGGLFARLSDGRLVNLSGSGTSNEGGDSIWTLNDDSSIFYDLGNVGVGTGTPKAALDVYQDTEFGSGALRVEQNVATGTGIWLDSSATGAPGMAISMSGETITSNNPHLLFGYNNRFDTNLYRPTFNTLRTDDNFNVAMTLSGNILAVQKNAVFSNSGIVFSLAGDAVFNEQSRDVDFRIESDGNANMFFVDASTNRVGIGTNAPKAALDVLGTASGTDVYASRNVSGSNIFANKSISGTYLYAATTFGGAGLATCSNAQNSKLLYNSATKQFTCGVDFNNSSNTGALRTAFDRRYVNVHGDTMTGNLIIRSSSGTNSLNLLTSGGMSGNFLSVSKNAVFANSGVIITASGQVVFNEQSRAIDFRIESDGNANMFVVDGSADRIGIGTNGPKATLDVLGTASGTNLYAAASITGTDIYAAVRFAGAGLTSCSNATSSKLLWNSTTKQFSCGTDQSGGGSSDFVNVSGDTMTGQLIIDMTGGVSTTIGLKLINALSGAVLHAEQSLSSSGILTVEGLSRFHDSMSLFRNNSIQMMLSSDATYQYITSYNSEPLAINYGVSANNTLINSIDGKLGVGLTTPGSKISFSGAMIIGANGAMNAVQAQTGVTLEILGTASGTNLYATKSITGTDLYAAVRFAGAGLTSCSNATSSKLLWNSTTKQFSCGTDQSGGGSSDFVNVSGDTMTGNLRLPGLAFMSGTTLVEQSGFNNYLNLINGGLGTNNVTRMTAVGNLVNIGSIQAGETHLRRGGTFATKVDYTAGDGANSIAMGDLNGDGKADLAVVGSNDAIVSVFLNNGDGTVAAKVDYATNASSNSVAIGDVNGDGKGDLAVTNVGSTVSIYINEGDGTFKAKVDYATASSPYGVVLTDLNGDGRADLAVANNSSTSVSVLLNNGNGTFASKVDYTTGSGPKAITAGDVNGDGKADLAVANFTDGDVSVLINNGNGTFATKVDYAATGLPDGVAMGDFNGDTKADLVVSAQGGNVSVYINNGDGTFASKVDYDPITNDPNTVAVGDLNGDGKLDLAVGGNLAVSVLMNKGNGTFTAETDYTAGSWVQSVAIGDLNGDGTADIAAANLLSDNISILMNVSRTILYASIGTGGTVGIGTSTPGSTLSVSGAVLINRNGTILNTAADAGLALEIVGNASGTNLFATKSITGSLIHSGLRFSGAGLTDCDADNQALGWDATTKQFTCGDDDGAGAGLNQSDGDNRYVNVHGDTMTGNLVIRSTSGASSLNFLVQGGMSGNFLSVSKNAVFANSGVVITSTGQTVFNEQSRNIDFRIESDGDANMFFVDGSANRIGIGTNGPKSTLDVVGTLSGRHLVISERATFSGSVVLGDSTNDIVTVEARFSGSLIPVTTNLYDLGSSALRWRDLYLSGGTLRIGSSALEGKIGYATTGYEGMRFFASGSAVNPSMVISSGGLVGIGKTGGFSDTPVKVADPGTSPTGDGRGTAFSPDGQYLSISHSTTPFLTIYKRSGDTFTKLTNPSTLPASTGYGTAFSPDGQYLSVANLGFPQVTIYKRSGDTFSKLANPSTLPTSTGYGTAFSPDGQYMTVAHASSPYITIYKRSGDTFTKLPDPAALPTGDAFGTTFSPDGQYLSVAHDVSPYVTIYKRSGDTFTKLQNPSSLPAGIGTSTSFSPDGKYLSVSHITSPYVTIYKRSGDAFSKLTDPGTLPGGNSYGTAFSTDGQYLAVGHNGVGAVAIYRRSGDTFTKIPDPAITPGGSVNGVAFSPDSQYLSVVNNTASPYVNIYKGAGTQVSHGLEIASHGYNASGADLLGLGFGKDVTLYRHGPGTLGLHDGGSFDIRGGTLRMGGTEVIDAGRRGYLDSLTITGTGAGYTTNTRSATITSGSGSPVGRLSGGTGSVYLDNYKGKVFIKTRRADTGGWEEVITGSGTSSLHMARITREAAQTVPNNSIFQKIYFDTKSFDVGGIANVANSSTGSGRITVKRAGKYLVTGQVNFDLGVNETGCVDIFKNNAYWAQSCTSAPATIEATPVTADLMDLAAGDYIELFMWQNGLSNRSTNTADEKVARLSVVEVNVAAGADLGEVYYTSDENLSPGDVVSIDPAMRAGVKKTSGLGDSMMLGVLSSQPSVIMGGLLPGETEPGKRVILALAGRVPVNVTNEGGAIAIGDPLTSSSIPGVAMKAANGGKIIGYALDSFSGSTIGRVLTFISNEHVPNPAGTNFFQDTLTGSLTITGDLSVDGSLSVLGGARFGSGVVIDVETATGTTDLFTVKAGSQHATAFRVQANGDVMAAGNISGGGADYAEWFKASDSTLIPGEAVCLDTTAENTVMRCRTSGDANVMGIISTKPAFIGNKYDTAVGKGGYALVGLIGQLPAKAIIENGEAIAVGDPVTSASLSGLIRRARPGESTVGVALTALSSGRGTVNVLITRKNQSDLVEAIERGVNESIASLGLEAQIDEMLTRSLASTDIAAAVEAAVEQRLASIDITGMVNAAIDLRVESGSTASLEARILELEGQLAVLTATPEELDRDLHAASIVTESGGLLFTGPIVPGNGFGIGSLSFSGSQVGIGSLLNKGSLKVLGNVTIDGIAEFLGNVDVKGELIVSGKQAGYAVIGKGATSVTVQFQTGFVAVPVVAVTPNGPVDSSWWTTRATGTGFEIRMKEAMNQDTPFSWIALSTANPAVSGGTVTASGGITALPFPVDELGRPFSEMNPIWTGCVQNHPVLDDDGQPYNCWRYREGFVWHHPDLDIDFTYNPNADPPIFIIPANYQLVTVMPEPEQSSSSSSEASESSSSASSLPAGVPQGGTEEGEASSESSSSAASSLPTEASSSEAQVGESSSSSIAPASSASSAAPQPPASSAPSEPVDEPVAQPPTPSIQIDGGNGEVIEVPAN